MNMTVSDETSFEENERDVDRADRKEKGGQKETGEWKVHIIDLNVIFDLCWVLEIVEETTIINVLVTHRLRWSGWELISKIEVTRWVGSACMRAMECTEAVMEILTIHTVRWVRTAEEGDQLLVRESTTNLQWPMVLLNQWCWHSNNFLQLRMTPSPTTSPSRSTTSTSWSSSEARWTSSSCHTRMKNGEQLHSFRQELYFLFILRAKTNVWSSTSYSRWDF